MINYPLSISFKLIANSQPEILHHSKSCYPCQAQLVLLYYRHMSLIAWAILIILAFIFIFLGSALVVFFTFYYNDGGTPGFGVAIFVLSAFIIAAFLPQYSSSPILPAATIAGAFLAVFLSLAAHFLLPYVDNKDLIVAFRPLIIFTVASGLLVAIANLAKVIAA